MIKNILKRVDRWSLKHWLIWSFLPGTTLTITMLVMAVVLQSTSLRVASLVAAVMAFVSTIVSAKELAEKTVWSWFVDARRDYAQGEAKRAEDRAGLLAEVQTLERVFENFGKDLHPKILQGASPRTISWLNENLRWNLLLLGEREYSPETYAALQVKRCSNCGTPLNGVDHNTEDYC